MSKNNKNKLVPKLRFPEFTMDSEWKQNDLGVLCQYWNGASHESGVCDDGNYFLISLNSIDINGNLKNEIKRISYTDNSLKTNDLVMVLSDVAHGNFLGLTDIIPNDKYVLNQRMAGLRIKDLNEANPQFIRYYINKSQKYFKSKGQGSSQLNLSKSAVTDFPVLKPPKLREQQKIAACLSSLDEVITAESQKLDVLKDHKKGLQQNLLPQAGETVPKFRFKEFEDSGEWVETRLDDICKFIRGPFGGALKKEIFVKDGYAVYEQSHAIYGDFSSFRYFITEEKYNELKRFSVEPNDIIMSCSGTMGKFAIVPYQSKKGVINQALLKLTVKTGYDTNFIKASLELPMNQNKLLSQSAGGAIKNVVEVAQIKEINLSIPSTIQEQEKIADTLSLIDELIIAQNQKLEALQLHKKGLLQGLFPNVNEVTE